MNDLTMVKCSTLYFAAYYCPNWHMVPVAVQTNTPSNTYCRAPGTLKTHCQIHLKSSFLNIHDVEQVRG